MLRARGEGSCPNQQYLIPLPGVILIKKGLRGGVGRVG